MIRFLDILFCVLIFLLISPLFVIVIAILGLTGEKEIFYKQERIGQNGNKFKIIKFATMLKNSPSLATKTITILNDKRILPFGHFLRKTKINELPQIFNVLLGDMSLIGPRPLTEDGFLNYSKEVQQSIKKMKPGVSGIGSIIFHDEEHLLNSVNSINLWKNVIAPHKGELELWYSKNISVFKYILLIGLTIIIIFFPKIKKYVYFLFKNLPKPDEKLRKILKLF
jgi:lipopolysaccharide/colanic/teichoic acid biosynthesis glycosyltransferase